MFYNKHYLLFVCFFYSLRTERHTGFHLYCNVFEGLKYQSFGNNSSKPKLMQTKIWYTHTLKGSSVQDILGTLGPVRTNWGF